jgi:hypothetical protein
MGGQFLPSFTVVRKALFPSFTEAILKFQYAIRKLVPVPRAGSLGEVD